MTIAVNDRLSSFSGDGTTTVFNYDYPIEVASDLVVTLRSATGVDTAQTLTTDYTVTIGSNGTGTVTFVTAPASGVTGYILGDTPARQPADYTESDRFPAASHEGSMDRLAKVLQELQRDMGRTVKAPTGETFADLAAALVRSNKFLGFDANGNLELKNGNVQGALTDEQVALLETLTEMVNAGLGKGGTLGASIRNYGANHAGIVLAEADDDAEYINLEGQTVTTTLTETQITKRYFNGTLLVANPSGNNSQFTRESPLRMPEIRRLQTKAPLTNWTGTKGLWHGTSIPHQLVTGDSYPALVAKGLGATVDNQAWSGSHIAFDITDDPQTAGAVRALTMTDADLAAELAEHGADSAFDNSFEAITVPEEQTLEHRVVEPIIANQPDWLVCDHNHNDRFRDPGTLTPTEYTVTAVTKGATTDVTVDDATGLVVGNGVAFKTMSGIGDMLYHPARVQAITGNTLTLAIDSSAYSGTFVSGTLVVLDRATLFGAFDFYQYGVWNAFIRAGQARPSPIIFCSAPSEFTNTDDDLASQSIRSNADYIYEWVTSRNNMIEDDGLDIPLHTFFDILYQLDIKEHDHLVYLPDGVHPKFADKTRVVANAWLEWLTGGAVRTWHESELLLSGSAPDPSDGSPAIYNAFYNGWGAPEWRRGALSSVLTEDFASISDWTGTGTPVAGAAPWNASETALNVTVTNGNTAQYIERDISNTADFLDESITFWTGSVTGAVTGGTATIPIMALLGNFTTHFEVQLLARSDSFQIRGAFLPATAGVGFSYTESVTLSPNTKHTIRILAARGNGADYQGGLVLFLDGVAIGTALRGDNSTRIPINKIRLGALSANATNTFTFSLGDYSLQQATLSPYTGEDGGLPYGALVAMDRGAPLQSGYRSAETALTLSQSQYGPLFEATGLLFDNDPAFSSEMGQLAADGGKIDNSTHTQIMDGEAGGSVRCLINATGDLWFARQGSELFASSTGIAGTWTEETSYQTDSAETPVDALGNENFAWGNGYLICMSETRLTVNTTQNDYTAWTVYDMRPGFAEHMAGVFYLNGWFFTLYWTASSGGNLCAAWTQDPTAQANWTTHENIFTYTNGSYSSPNLSDSRLYYFEDADKYALFIAHNDQTGNEHFFEVWTLDDPSTETVFVENTAVSSTYSPVSDAANGFSLGWAFEASGQIVVTMFFAGEGTYAVFDDITAAPRIFQTDDTIINTSGSGHGQPLQIPNLVSDNGAIFKSRDSEILHYFELVGTELKHGSTPLFRNTFPATTADFTSVTSPWLNLVYDDKTKALVGISRSDASVTNRHHAWSYPMISYDQATQFHVPAARHENRKLVYQRKVE